LWCLRNFRCCPLTDFIRGWHMFVSPFPNTSALSIPRRPPPLAQGGAGRLEAAEATWELMRLEHIEPTEEAWGALLHACEDANAPQRALFWFKQLKQSEPATTLQVYHYNPLIGVLWNNQQHLTALHLLQVKCQAHAAALTCAARSGGMMCRTCVSRRRFSLPWPLGCAR
jgi:hypothetical protein